MSKSLIMVKVAVAVVTAETKHSSFWLDWEFLSLKCIQGLSDIAEGHK